MMTKILLVGKYAICKQGESQFDWLYDPINQWEGDLSCRSPFYWTHTDLIKKNKISIFPYGLPTHYAI